VNTNKWWILMSAGIALAVSLAYTFLLRIAALPLTIVILVAIWFNPSLCISLSPPLSFSLYIYIYVHICI